MRIVRLFWAGVQIESQGATLVIDLLEQTAPIRPFMGDPRLPIVFGSEVLDFALVTHLHPDHYDPDTLGVEITAVSRTLLSLASGQECRGRRLSIA